MDEDKKLNKVEGTVAKKKKIASKKASKKKVVKKRKPASKKKLAPKKVAQKVELDSIPEIDVPEPAVKPKAKINTKPNKVKVTTKMPMATPSKPITFTSESRKKKKSGKVGVFFMFLFFVIIAGVIGVLYFQAQTVQKQTVTSTQTLREDVNSEVASLKSRLQMLTQEFEKQKEEVGKIEMGEYTNAELGISFQYPMSLGEPSAEIKTLEAVLPETVNANLLIVTFASNPDIWILAATNNYDDQTGVAYLGKAESLTTLCDEPLSVTEEGYCDYFSTASQDTVELVKVLGDEKVSNIIMQTILNLSESVTYDGFALQVSLGTPPVAGRNLFAPSDEQDLDAALESYLRNIIKEENLSLITKQNIEAYNTIRDSLELTQ
jgi:hypothetical protein